MSRYKCQCGYVSRKAEERDLHAKICGKAHSPAPAGSLLSAAKTAAKWMRWWLDRNECECDGPHHCGKDERRRELDAIELEISKAENK